MLHTSVICLFCEDLREEKKGTDTLIGILPDNITIAEAPAMFTKLALYARIQAPTEKPPSSVSLRLELPGGETVDLGEMPVDKITKAVETARREGAPYIGLILKAIMTGITVDSSGRLSAIAHLDGEEYLAGTLNVKIEQESPSP